MLRLTLLTAVLAAACAAGSTPACHSDADCASGICNQATLTCSPVPDGGRANDGGPSGDAGPMTPVDAGPTPGDGGSGDAGPQQMGSCLPQNNGTIARAQEPLEAGLNATFLTASNSTTGVTVDTAGTATGSTYTWDFTGMLPGDQDDAVALQPASGQWYSSSFTSASYATPLSPSSNLLGIFQLTDTQLLLLGVVSPTGTLPAPLIGSTQTLLTYSPPVTVLQFPFKQGDTWTSTSTVMGTAEGVTSYYTEQYTNTVDKSGTVLTPYSTTPFPVLRVNTVLVRTVGVVPTTTRTISFIAECFSAVATITSLPDETTTEFTSAASIQRLAL